VWWFPMEGVGTQWQGCMSIRIWGVGRALDLAAADELGVLAAVPALGIVVWRKGPGRPVLAQQRHEGHVKVAHEGVADHRHLPHAVRRELRAERRGRGHPSRGVPVSVSATGNILHTRPKTRRVRALLGVAHPLMRRAEPCQRVKFPPLCDAQRRPPCTDPFARGCTIFFATHRWEGQQQHQDRQQGKRPVCCPARRVMRGRGSNHDAHEADYLPPPSKGFVMRRTCLSSTNKNRFSIT